MTCRILCRALGRTADCTATPPDPQRLQTFLRSCLIISECSECFGAHVEATPRMACQRRSASSRPHKVRRAEVNAAPGASADCERVFLKSVMAQTALQTLYGCIDLSADGTALHGSALPLIHTQVAARPSGVCCSLLAASARMGASSARRSASLRAQVQSQVTGGVVRTTDGSGLKKTHKCSESHASRLHEQDCAMQCRCHSKGGRGRGEGRPQASPPCTARHALLHSTAPYCACSCRTPLRCRLSAKYCFGAFWSREASKCEELP